MNRSISNSKKLIPVFILFVIAFSLVFSFAQTYTAFATPATRYRSCDFSSGIVFDNYENIGIESQTLDITVNEDLTADISVKYIIKNYSEESLSVNSLFFFSAVFGENRDIIIERNDENLDCSQEFFEACNLYRGECYDGHGQSVEEWENILFVSENEYDSDFEGGYITAIIFIIKCAPLEQIELNVSYSCRPGGRISGQELTGDSLIFSYYFSPAKYAKDFKSFEINLTLDKKYNKPDTALIKTGDKTYQYKSTSLPEGYLQYNFDNEKSYFWIVVLVIIIILAVAAFALFLIKVAVVAVVVPIGGLIFKSLIKLFKNNKN